MKLSFILFWSPCGDICTWWYVYWFYFCIMLTVKALKILDSYDLFSWNTIFTINYWREIWTLCWKNLKFDTKWSYKFGFSIQENKMRYRNNFLIFLVISDITVLRCSIERFVKYISIVVIQFRIWIYNHLMLNVSDPILGFKFQNVISSKMV